MGRGEIFGLVGPTGADEITIANNILTGSEAYSLAVHFSGAVVTHDLFTEWHGSFDESHGLNAIEVADPLLMNPDAGDYSLASGSPAVDAGNDDHAPSADIAGTLRPQGSSVDVGAFEFTP